MTTESNEQKLYKLMDCYYQTLDSDIERTLVLTSHISSFNVNWQNENGTTFLHLACFRLRREAFRLLLSLFPNINPNAPNNNETDGWTPLQYVCGSYRHCQF